jgi:hypothetical protein
MQKPKKGIELLITSKLTVMQLKLSQHKFSKKSAKVKK